MIDSIINIFYNEARQHKLIRAFYYGRHYELGSGKDAYPLFWLEDPVRGSNRNNVFTNSVSFSILFLPTGKETRESVSHLQNLAFSTGLNIIERIKRDRNTLGISITPDWDFLTLSDYYDDNAVGCRFSITFTQGNMQNLCLIDEQFDSDKELEGNQALRDFDISPAGNCEVFVNKFPDFELKTRK